MAETPDLAAALSLEFVDELYASYRRDPSSVAAEWRSYFESLEQEIEQEREGDGRAAPAPERGRLERLQDRLDQLIDAYRSRGHLVAAIDPLGRERPMPPDLDPAYWGFKEGDLDEIFSCASLPPPKWRSLREILDLLRETYCKSIGVEFMHIEELEVRSWLQERMESTHNRLDLDYESQIRILTRLTDAIVFEQFVRTKFIGAKSFSLEGAETLIPLLETAIETAGDHGVDEIVMAMAHRGRLNVLVNILGQDTREVFREFEAPDPTPFQGGDVRYHLGYSSDWRTRAGRDVHLSLCFNPSHLEFIDPIALGRTRGKQDREEDRERTRAMTLLIHGDASLAGEGVVQEALNLSELYGYETGGTLHVVVNNQIGFTTLPEEGRSTLYATDVAKMLQIPIFHVNGEDPEAVTQAVHLAMEFRRTFGRDAFIDMYCFRRLGHNELDDPTFTQPLTYQRIEQRRSVRKAYLERLLATGKITEEEGEQIEVRCREELGKKLEEAREQGPREEGQTSSPAPRGIWRGYFGGPAELAGDPDTAVAATRLAELLLSQTRLPPHFKPHPRFRKFFAAREKMAAGERPLDWSAAEGLAFATLATDGVTIRLSGQDSVRGTFSQRHAVLFDRETGEAYMPLAHLAPDQAEVAILNSPLSELGVLGFDYGYSLDRPDALTMWEAQFGDFTNAAQVVIDQFVVSAEQKWQRLSGLVLLLPHGFEGQGPEHSSARLERFLSLAAADNIQVAIPTTPAQYFHLLRRQALRRWRKPLVVMTPKSLLRHRLCVSPLESFSRGRFRPVLPDPAPRLEREASRVLLCAGKIYYDLVKVREEEGRSDVAIVRVEELVPLPARALREVIARYPKEAPLFWVQEEPANMGAWCTMRLGFFDQSLADRPLRRVSRPPSSTPATGSSAAHRTEQRMICEEALGITSD